VGLGGLTWRAAIIPGEDRVTSIRAGGDPALDVSMEEK